MRRFLAVFVFLVLVTPQSAGAVSGVNIRWSKCYSDGGTLNKTFTCSGNTGSQTAVLAFKLDHTKTNVSGIEVYLALSSTNATMPAWWLLNTGGCRGSSPGQSSSLSGNSALPAGSVNCVDWSGGQAAGGLAAYIVGGVAPNQARITLGWAVAPGNERTFNPGQEYFVCNLVLNNNKTVGTGACGGCTTPVVIFLEGMILATPTNVNETVNLPSNEPQSQWVTWQNGVLTNLQRTTCVPNVSANCQVALRTTLSASTGTTMRASKAGPR